MPLYFFRVLNGPFAGTDEVGFDLPDRQQAWAETANVCGDLVGGIARKLGENTDWQMELLDEARKPLFRIRLLAETLA